MKKVLMTMAIAIIASAPALAQNGVMLMNRIGPSKSVLYVADANGKNEHALFPNSSAIEYNASFSADGKWIVFTSERAGDGQADIYPVHPDGSGLERLTDNPAMDDQGALSPDGTQLAFVSTRESKLHTANVWVLDLKTKKARNLTGSAEIQSTTPGKPDAFLRPSWSPDGKWIAFSSDRNTEWKGAEQGAGAGHTQELSIYIIQPDGKGFRRITQAGTSAGSPKWSADGKSIICYEIDPKATFNARMGGVGGGSQAQIVSIDVATGTAKPETSGPGLKVSPQYLADGRIGYLVKGGWTGPGPQPAARGNRGGPTGPPPPPPGVAYNNGGTVIEGAVRNPAWSPDGKLVIYQRTDFTARPQNAPLYSWDPQREYRYTDVFPVFSVKGRLAVTDLNSQMGNPSASLSVMDGDGSNRQKVFSDPSGAAMMPSWSPDGKQLVFGFGGFFPARDFRPARLIVINEDGSGAKDLTGTTPNEPNTGFPSWSPDSKKIVFRVWGKDVRGLKVMNLEDHSVKVLTTDWDNFPFWSPDGKKILFTRQKDVDFDIFLMNADGTDVQQLTNSPGSDGHANWTADGKQIIFSSSRAGFKDEGPLYDNSPQPYAQVFMMNADGSNQHQVTDSRWEDSMGVYVPAKK